MFNHAEVDFEIKAGDRIAQVWRGRGLSSWEMSFYDLEI